MGVFDTNRRPILPAPTDSLLGSADEAPVDADVATELSHATDRSHQTIPDDGSPITITTGPHKSGIGRAVKSANPSQTSLLIEYFEHGPDSGRKPSVRVKVNPSSGRRAKERERGAGAGHIVVTEAKADRRRSQSHRIALGHGPAVDSTLSSLDSDARAPPFEIEVNQGSDLSHRSDSPEPRYIVPGSDISSMPPDSMLGVAPPERLKPAVMSTARNLSNERIAQKVIEKISNKPRASAKAGSAHTRSQSAVSRDLAAEPRRRSGKQSNVSVNNPKLLQTVEDVIRRLILPELKEIKKDQRHSSHSKTAKDVQLSDVSESSVSREEPATRRHSSGKSKRRTSRSHGTSRRRVSSSSRKHDHRRQMDGYDTASERSYQASESLDSVSVDDDLKQRQHKPGLAVSTVTGAALTMAALKHHDSASTLDSSRERRKKRSKSRSSRSGRSGRSASMAESDEIFHKHGVPPMPMRSEAETELTRSSLLSSNTASTATPIQREHDLVVAHADQGDEDEDEAEYGNDGYSAGLGSFGHGLLTDPERARAYESNLHHQHPIRRGLSPIQSVASYATTEANRNSLIQPRSVESIRSARKEADVADEISIASISSAPSTDLARSRRPHGISLENRSEIMQPHNNDGVIKNTLRPGAAAASLAAHPNSGTHSYSSSDLKDEQRRSNYADLAEDDPYVDKVIAGRQLSLGHGANPQFIHPSAAVESAVASLCEPSVLGTQSIQSAHVSQVDSSLSPDLKTRPKLDQEVAHVLKAASPLKHQYSFEGDEQQTRALHLPRHSPPQSPARSFAEHDGQHHQHHQHHRHHIPVLPKSSDTLTKVAALEDATQASPESEITTNPSVIQGPIAGYTTGNRDHWPYDPTPPGPADIMSPGLGSRSRDLSSAHANLVPEALAIGPRVAAESKILPALVDPAPLGGANDEGYETGVTAANAPSPVTHERTIPPRPAFSPGLQMTSPLNADEVVAEEAEQDDDDPFTSQKRREYVSGLSQGMSPLYDTANGRGIDRIKSKDIVALMDHLTVRDAQRSARDTEILMSLVTTAAEMRNSFEDMKKFIADQGDEIMDTADKQHDKTQRRPNIFRRAFRGLGNKNTQELQHIEAMLMQLLDDVDNLKAFHQTSQSQPRPGNEPRSTSITSADQGHIGTDPGYEPEGQAGTSSTGDRSGIFSNNSSRQANYRGLGAPLGATGNRVSTVIERDEEYEGVDLALDRDLSTTPRPPYPDQDGHQARSSSVPVHTPPRLHDDVNQGALSNEQPSRYYSIEGSSGKKQKSFASTILPKLPISRWSKTTASSTGDYRSTMQTHAKGRPYSPGSQSGINMPAYEYDAHGDDRLRSNTSFQHDEQQYRDDENRAPSPLVPSQVSDNPKYQAHRNSSNLQHPQPRQGPTGRYQNTLENEAQYYGQNAISPTSVTSSQWESQAAVAGMMDGIPHDREYQSGRGANISPISIPHHSGLSDAVPQQASSVTFTKGGQPQAPPLRPPKIALSDANSEPLMPPRPPKQMLSPPGGGGSGSASRQATYVDHVAAARAGSPAYDKMKSVTYLRTAILAQSGAKTERSKAAESHWCEWQGKDRRFEYRQENQV
ncbi:hypothetical protein DV736_g6537, partial [Chaetothyriales sp. CBS 134916]